MAGIRLVRGFLTVGAWTMASRVLGFVRDWPVASTAGTWRFGVLGAEAAAVPTRGTGWQAWSPRSSVSVKVPGTADEKVTEK